VEIARRDDVDDVGEPGGDGGSSMGGDDLAMGGENMTSMREPRMSR
jgi:hypothetical protein